MDQEISRLWQGYQAVRTCSMQLCESLNIDDLNLQAMPETSPLKWHLAHTSWFFETFLLKPYLPAYRTINRHYEYLFNSYYNAVGKQFPRSQRHLLSRPSYDEVCAYRQVIDELMHALLMSAHAGSDVLIQRLILGMNHEQQHQELMLTDLKFNWALNPLHPVFSTSPLPASVVPEPLCFTECEQGLFTVGYTPDDASDPAQFAFDNEGPAHRVWLDACAVANRLITNGEFIEFIEDGGYENPRWWSSDGWASVQAEAWQAPLYWEKHDHAYWHFTLHGFLKVDVNAPVCHVSLYEAQAFASWRGCRLCREAEWEVMAKTQSTQGHFMDLAYTHPYTAQSDDSGPGASGLKHMFGDVWEWTQSAYSPYPGYRPAEGALGEYNGKFMMNQCVLRGGSVATPQGHIRPSYRNFFYPNDRWQFSGLRLAHDS